MDSRTMRRAVVPQMARRINDRIVLDLLLEQGPLTRNQLRDMTGMSQPSTLQLIERLEAEQLIVPVGEADAARRGPKARLYGLVAERSYAALTRVNAYEACAVIADITGRSLSRVVHPVSDVDDPVSAVLGVLGEAGAEVGLDPAAAGQVLVGTPGLVDPRTGDVGYVDNLPGWRGGLRAPLEHHVGRTVRLENQMNLAGIAEHRHGAGRGRDSFVLMSISHAVAVAVIMHNRVWRGVSGGAGELAWLPAAGSDVPAVDSQQHTVAGGYSTLVSDGSLRQLAERYGFRDSSAAAAVRQTLAADADGGPFLAALADRIAVGVAATCAVLDPGLVVLTGEIGRAGGETLAYQVEQRLTSMSPLPTQIRCTGVTGDPVLQGAIVTALSDIHDEFWGPASPPV